MPSHTFEKPSMTGWLATDEIDLTALSAQTGYIMPQEYEIHCGGPGDKINMQ